MFNSRDIKKEYRLSTWRIRTNDNRRGTKQCVPLTLVDDQESIIIPMKPKPEPREERCIGNTIIRRF